MNILYIGSAGPLSLIPFRKLLSAEYSVIAVGVDNPISFQNRVIAQGNESLALAARQQDIPLIDLSLPDNEVIKQCREYHIDVIVMSCYGKRLPEEIAGLAAKGSFNMHPSLLPAYRGPEPIFWQMRDAAEVGVSWHRVAGELDAGDIVMQQKVSLPDGASYTEISQQLARTGAELMLQLLSAISADQLSAIAQDPAHAGYNPWPDAGDFVIDTAWSAQHAANFIYATQHFGQPYCCRLGGFNYQFDRIAGCDNGLSMNAEEIRGDRLYIPCKEGVLIVHYTGKIPV